MGNVKMHMEERMAQGVGTVDLASISELTSAPSFTSFLVHGVPLKIPQYQLLPAQ